MATRKHRSAFTPTYRRLRRKNNSGHDLAFVEVDGHRYYLGAYDTPESREKYHRLIAEWEANGRSFSAEPLEITVVEVVNAYMKWARTYYVKHEHVTDEPANIALALRPMKELYGGVKAADFGPKALKTVRDKMVQQGWVRKHINKQVDRIKRMFKWAVAEELVPSGLYEGLRAVSGLRYGRCGARDNPPVQPARMDLVEATKQHVSPQVAAMIDLQLHTGARPGEVIIMRPGDIDRSGAVWLYRPLEHKTEHHGCERVIFIGPQGQRILAPYLLRAPGTYCFSPAEAEETRRRVMHEERITPEGQGNIPGSHCKDDPLWTPGERYTNDSYRRAIERGIERAFPLPEHLSRRMSNGGKLETIKEWEARLTPREKAEIKEWRRQHHWHPHQLRHNAATNARREEGLETAQVFLGHSKADVTQIYAERDMERAMRVALKIG